MRLLRADERDIELGENLLVMLRDDDDHLHELDGLENRILEHQAATERLTETALTVVRATRRSCLEERRLVAQWFEDRGFQELHADLQTYLQEELGKLGDGSLQQCAACNGWHAGSCQESLG